MKKSLSKRLKVTKSGKVLRRAMGLGHCRSKKSGTQMNRRRGMRGLQNSASIFRQNQ